MTESVKPALAEKAPGVLGACSRFCREKIGWHQVGFAVSLTIIAVAFWVLYDILHDLDVEEVLSAMQATPLHNIFLAALFVAAAYFTLTFYDLFALRTIGRRDVPYRGAALAGFTSYSIGHNVGASVFTGVAVRYRIYSTWRLDAGEVAKICFRTVSRGKGRTTRHIHLDGEAECRSRYGETQCGVGAEAPATASIATTREFCALLNAAHPGRVSMPVGLLLPLATVCWPAPSAR